MSGFGTNPVFGLIRFLDVSGFQTSTVLITNPWNIKCPKTGFFVWYQTMGERHFEKGVKKFFDLTLYLSQYCENCQSSIGWLFKYNSYFILFLQTFCACQKHDHISLVGDHNPLVDIKGGKKHYSTWDLFV